MSYYILPKTTNNILFNPIDDYQDCSLYVSQSLFNYFNEVMNQIYDISLYENDLSLNTFDKIIKVINSYI